LIESGAGALSLAVANSDVISAMSTLGGRFSTAFDLGNGSLLSLTGRLAWAHEFANDNTVTTAAFTAGMQDIPMQFSTAQSGRDGAVGGLGLNLKTRSGAEFYVDFGADVRKRDTNLAATAGVRWTFDPPAASLVKQTPDVMPTLRTPTEAAVVQTPFEPAITQSPTAPPLRTSPCNPMRVNDGNADQFVRQQSCG
jgi:hypothetical protein